MTPRGRGYGVTPRRVIEELHKKIEGGETMYTIAQKTGLSYSVIHALFKGNREPSTGTFKKLSTYLNIPIEWLKGNPFFTKDGAIDFNDVKPLAICAECGSELHPSQEGFYREWDDGTFEEGDGIMRFWPCETCMDRKVEETERAFTENSVYLQKLIDEGKITMGEPTVAYSNPLSRAMDELEKEGEA